jgi:aminoglycoside phosphotransferase (APT) family kinase protein
MTEDEGTRDAAPPGLDAPGFAAWFVDHVAAARAPLRCSLIAGGHSNLTFRIEDAAGARFALRRPPLGTFPRSAHDVAREHRILSALQGSAVPVPKVHVLCTDPGVIGAPFYVMDFVAGTILDRASGVSAALPDAAARRAAALHLVDALAALHQVDVDAVGLGDLGRREHYLPRQLERLHSVWHQTKTRELPLIDSLHQRLAAHCPPQRRTGLVHSDFRFGNVVLDASHRVAAVLDWELCALGDVLVDVGFLLDNWDEPGDAWPDVWMQPAPTRAGGFPTRSEIAARYAVRSGIDIGTLDYYRAFCYWRIAVIAEGIKRRYESGAMSSHTADSSELERRVRERAELANHFLSCAGL